MFQAVVQEAPSTQICGSRVSGQDVKLKSCVLLVIHFTAAAWRHVIPSTIVNCFCQCGYGHEHNTEANSDVDSSIEDEHAFCEDWI
jgi:hypothetical protein